MAAATMMPHATMMPAAIERRGALADYDAVYFRY